MVDSHGQVLAWIQEAYPDGIDEADAAALLALLQQRLGASRAMQMSLSLVAAGTLDAAAGARGAAPTSPIPQLDLRRVASRLVLGGWPLGSLTGEDDEDDTEEGSYLGRIVAWLRAGYPQGVPEHDYVPLLALLNRRLTRGEVKKVAKALRRASISPASAEDIAAAITEVTHTEASSSDTARVRERLAAKGWPVDFPDPDAH